MSDRADEIARLMLDDIPDEGLPLAYDVEVFFLPRIAAALRAYGDERLEAAAAMFNDGEYYIGQAASAFIRSLKSKPESKEPTR